MKIIFFVLFLMSTSLCYSGTLTLDKNTGKFIQYRSEKVKSGSMIQEAVNCGYKSEDVEEKEITDDEWLIIKEEQFDKPNREINKSNEDKHKKDKEKVLKKLKVLGLTEDEINSLVND